MNVLGWGNPYFSALYDECYSVFGCYDAQTTSVDQAKHTSYEVIGWYSDEGEDYVQSSLQGTLQARQAEVLDAASVLSRAESDLLEAEQADALVGSDETAALADARESVAMAEALKQEKVSAAIGTGGVGRGELGDRGCVGRDVEDAVFWSDCVCGGCELGRWDRYDDDRVGSGAEQ